MPLRFSTAYFPPAHWFTAAIATGNWVTEAHENYQRKGFRNRARIVGPNGLQWLSVPLPKGKNQQTPIREVLLANDNDWRREHVRAIATAYGRSPFYEYYAEELFTVLRADHTTLYELNRALTQRIIDLLQLPIRLTQTEDFGGALSVKHHPPLAEYPQVFTERHGFQPGLSVLDALFCLGPAFAYQPTERTEGSGTKLWP